MGIAPKVKKKGSFFLKTCSRCKGNFGPENFKKCVRCGDMVLKDASFFMRKSRSSDGFASRCKFCEREIRGGKK